MADPAGSGTNRPKFAVSATADLLTILKVPSLRLFIASRACGGTATGLLLALIAWQVYDISRSALDLGLIALVRFVPSLAVSFVGGAVADTYNRRTVLMLSHLVPGAATIAILAAIALDVVTIEVLYGVALVTGLSMSFEQPARAALLPQLVDRTLFPRAVSFNAVIHSLSQITGPVLAGGLIAWQGVGHAWAVHGVLIALSILFLVNVRVSSQQSARRGVRLEAIREGLVFVWRRPVLLGAMSLDLFAVIFGGAKAMLPIYAVDILQVGATGYGILTAAIEAGALLTSFALIVMPLPRRTGQALLLATFAFGIGTMLFGLSRSFPLSILAYVLVGVADQFGVVMRQTTIQLTTPDELRGRVSAVNSVFFGASNQLGQVESGLVAAITSATFAVVSGGAACLGVVAWIAWKIPELRNYQVPSRDELMDSDSTPGTASHAVEPGDTGKQPESRQPVLH